jgi:tRNA-2-methylthio-N6-dimethylallyladenosine synthase
VTVTITEAAAFHLIADPATADDYSLRRSRAGDAWDRAQADSCGAPAPGAAGAAGSGKTGVSLGMPSLPVRSR